VGIVARQEQLGKKSNNERQEKGNGKEQDRAWPGGALGPITLARTLSSAEEKR